MIALNQAPGHQWRPSSQLSHLSTAIRQMLELERKTAVHWTQPIAAHTQPWVDNIDKV